MVVVPDGHGAPMLALFHRALHTRIGHDAIHSLLVSYSSQQFLSLQCVHCDAVCQLFMYSAVFSSFSIFTHIGDAKVARLVISSNLVRVRAHHAE